MTPTRDNDDLERDGAPRSDHDADRTEVAARLAIAVGRLNRLVRPSSSGLSHGMLSLLSTIARQGPLRPSDLARIEVVAAPTITRAVADLEGRGLVERRADPDDRRAFFVTATDAGEQAVLDARAERAARVAALLADCTDAEIDGIRSALPALEAAAHVAPVHSGR
jgi:DNA-binding MarR family transcriptional regulator